LRGPKREVFDDEIPFAKFQMKDKDRLSSRDVINAGKTMAFPREVDTLKVEIRIDKLEKSVAKAVAIHIKPDSDK
jgi:hypothetical protein